MGDFSSDQTPLSLASGFERSGRSVDEVWTTYLTMGGALERPDIVRALRGQTTLDRFEHNKLAAALNEFYVEAGQDHPVRYDDSVDPD
jgi:hypothetical protein